jgi:hypothetical protein
MACENLLAHRHGTRGGRTSRRLHVAARERRGEREQTSGTDDLLRDGIMAFEERVERNRLSALQPLDHGIGAHERAEVDVVSRMDRRERFGHRELDPRPLFALRRGFTRRARPLPGGRTR